MSAPTRRFQSRRHRPPQRLRSRRRIRRPRQPVRPPRSPPPICGSPPTARRTATAARPGRSTRCGPLSTGPHPVRPSAFVPAAIATKRGGASPRPACASSVTDRIGPSSPARVASAARRRESKRARPPSGASTGSSAAGPMLRRHNATTGATSPTRSEPTTRQPRPPSRCGRDPRRTTCTTCVSPTGSTSRPTSSCTTRRTRCSISAATPPDSGSNGRRSSRRSIWRRALPAPASAASPSRATRRTTATRSVRSGCSPTTLASRTSPFATRPRPRCSSAGAMAKRPNR